ncbi:MAG: hypothetical protein L6Q83_01820 [Gammaproteobacteria bacterium]|nr:hypothetical protein [Gammaproteobacteria bacterium]
MRKPNYQQARKQKEQSRKQRQSEKQQRRTARVNKTDEPDAGPEAGQDTPAVPSPAHEPG